MSDPSDATPGTNKKRWLGWVVAAIAVPPLLAAATTTVSDDRIEDDLTARTESALAGAGYQDAEVRFHGRDATITVASGADATRIRKLAERVDGNRVVRVKTASAAPAGKPFSVERFDGDFTVTATVPDDASKETFLRAVPAKAGSVGMDLAIESGATVPNATTVGSLITALGDDAGDRAITVEGDTITITGTVTSMEEKALVGRAAGEAISPSAQVRNELTVDAEAAAAAERAALAEVTGVLAASTVNFLPDSSTLTPSGAAAVRRVAAVLAKYPTVRAEVRGHVANTGSARADQRLSLARANAVVGTLRRSGIAAPRLVATGLGSSKPVTTNPAQTSRNRRVEFAILGGMK